MADTLEKELRGLGLPGRAVWALIRAVPDATSVEEVKAGLADMSEGQFCYVPNFSDKSLKAINAVFGPWPFRKTDAARQELDEKIEKVARSIDAAKKSIATRERKLAMLQRKRAALDN